MSWQQNIRTGAYTVRTFEYDDYPQNAHRIIRICDKLKERYPNFKATFFTVPTWIKGNRRANKLVEERSEWIKMAPHGFCHQKKECRVRDLWTQHLKYLDKMASKESDVWVKQFKAPWVGYSTEFLSELMVRGFSVCLKSTGSLPYPASDGLLIWNISDAQEAAKINYGRHWYGWHAELHPIYKTLRGKWKASKTEISDAIINRVTHYWTPEDQFEFCHNLVRPSLLKLNLGCGPQVWDDWACLDPRAEELGPNVIKWDASKMLPFGTDKADLICTSHMLNYVPEDFYPHFFLDCYRVLRPGAVLRLAEDRTDNGYTWRGLGSTKTHGQGMIKSLPTKQKVLDALAKVHGFEVREVDQYTTQSPHDALRTNTRSMRYRRGHKFYIEAVKRVRPGYSESRPRLAERRATLQGRWKLKEKHQLFWPE